MQFRVVLACLFIVSPDVFKQCFAESVEASCDTNCNCGEEVHIDASKEYRVICEGDRTQEVILTNQVFHTEKKPRWNRKVYVRVANFTEMKIKENFLAKWLAYTSCSLDIWDSGKVIFPEKVPPKARTRALTFVFAGIGFEQSYLDKLPNGLFKDRDKIGLRFSETTVNYLNLFKLGAKSTNYLVAINSLIKVLDGNSSNSLTLAKDKRKGDAKIEFQNSQIGYMSSNSLSFDEYKSAAEAKVTINGSVIGLLETSAIKIGKGISLEIQESILSSVMPAAFSFDDERRYSSALRKNFIGADTFSMDQLKCDSSLQIQDNLIFPKEVLQNCIPEGDENPLSSSCNESLEISNYIDTSCKNNYIIGKHYQPPQRTELPKDMTTSATTVPVPGSETTVTTTTRTTHSPTTSSSIITPPPVPTTSDASLTPTLCIPPLMPVPPDYNSTSSKNASENTSSGFWDKVISEKTVSRTLFYVVLGFCIFLLIVVIILTAFIVWRKDRNTDKLRKASKYDLNEDKELEMYFCSNSKPLHTRPTSFTNLGETDEDWRAQPLSLKK